MEWRGLPKRSRGAIELVRRLCDEEDEEHIPRKLLRTDIPGEKKRGGSKIKCIAEYLLHMIAYVGPYEAFKIKLC